MADGFAGEFKSRIPLVFFGDALMSVDVQVLQVHSDVGYLRRAVVYERSGFRFVGVEEGHHLLLRTAEVMENFSPGFQGLVVLSVGLLLETAGGGACAHGCE